MTTHRMTRMLSTALFLSCVSLGCSEQQAQQLGDATTENASKAGDSLRQAARSLGKALTKVKQGLDDAELAGKVYARILWDRNLQEAKVSIDAKPGGIVTVRGKVPSRAVRRTLLDLAESTIGVTQVQDELEVDPDLGTERHAEETSDRKLR